MTKMVHYMKMRPNFKAMVDCYAKTIECRLNDEKRQLIKKGDSIVFTDEYGEDGIKRVVGKKKVFPTFREALESCDLEDLLPIFTKSLFYSFEKALDVYYNIPGYKENEEKYGVVLFYLI